MKTKFVFALFVIFFSVFSSAQDFYLHDGDRLVFYGDSITEQKLYTHFIESYVRTRFPHMNIEFWNAGVGGDTVRGGWAGPIDERLKRDLLAYKPTVVTIMLGMNDGQYRAFDQSVFDQYTTGYKNIVQTLKRDLPGVRITVLQPSPFDDVTRPPNFPGGYNAVLKRFSDFVAQYGAEQGLTVVDVNSPVVAELEQARKWNPEAAKFIIPDRVHPGDAGHWVMALAVLKKWNAPALVTRTEIDASAPKSVKSDNTAVSDLQKSANGISWTQLDKALPLDFNPDNINAELAERFAHVTEMLNQEPLKISGLQPGKYQLSIDGHSQGEYTAEQFATGINLAHLQTPMFEQAGNLSWRIISERNDFHLMRIRILVHGKGSPESQQAAAYLEKMENDKAAEAHEAVVPKPHKFEVTKQ